ncbi:phage integrase N-terminal SAM-like domain-containing protein, partial [Candidatus Bathyarchaeota archaeon]|nr:phage integrase N-terminal SAM-like domain-containing protein [Candidatus Bathyarchaeota archaeon]
MQTRVGEFDLSLHGVRDSTKENYLGRIEWFAGFLAKQGLVRFEDACKKDIDLFLSGYRNPSTKNLFIQVLRSLYKDLKPEVVAHLRIYAVELEEITPSELLTPDEVIKIAEEAGKRR